MSDNKKYYYLKLKDNFFESDAMIVLESMPDGYKYSNILLKLFLRSLKDDGRLMFNDRIPYNPTILAQVTRHSVGDVERAINVLKELNLIEILDNGAIYMTDIQNYIGQSSTEADRKRAYRKRIESEKNNQKTIGGQMSDKCPDKSPPEIEIEKEKERELEQETERQDKSRPPVADNAFSFYEKNGFGTLAPLIIEKMNDWINDFKDKGTSEREANQIIKQALTIAVERNKRHWNYVNGILNSWFNDGLYSIDDIEAKENQWKKDVEQKQKEREGGYGGLEF